MSYPSKAAWGSRCAIVTRRERGPGVWGISRTGETGGGRGDMALTMRRMPLRRDAYRDGEEGEMAI